jgi:hypothetical protein
METMTPQHERWIEFYNRLSDAVTRHGCRHGTEKGREILGAMGFSQDEVDASLAGFAEAGGFCDCEILMNCLGGPDGELGLTPVENGPVDEVITLRNRVLELEAAVDWLEAEKDRLCVFVAAVPQEPCEVCGWPKEQDGRCVKCEAAMQEAQREGVGNVTT